MNVVKMYTEFDGQTIVMFIVTNCNEMYPLCDDVSFNCGEMYPLVTSPKHGHMCHP